MSSLDRLAKIGAIERSTVTVNGETFHVRSLDAVQRGALQAALRENNHIPDYVVVAHGMIEEDGSPIAPSIEVAVEKLRSLRGTVISEIASAVYKVSALDPNALEESEKN